MATVRNDSWCGQALQSSNRMRSHELLEQHLVYRPGRLSIRPLLQSAQRRRTGPGLHPVGRRLQRQVVPQFPMIVGAWNDLVFTSPRNSIS